MTTEAHPDPLREALEWYAEQVGSCRKNTSEGDEARRQLDRDVGNRARAALAADPQPAPTFSYECPVCQEEITRDSPERPYCGICAEDNGRDVRMRSVSKAPQPATSTRKPLFDLQRSHDYPGGANVKADRKLYNVIDIPGMFRGQIALTDDEAEAIGGMIFSAEKQPAPHVNEPPEIEHEPGDVLTVDREALARACSQADAPTAGETLAWGLVGKDRRVIPGAVFSWKHNAEVHKDRGERVVRVAIREVPE